MRLVKKDKRFKDGYRLPTYCNQHQKDVHNKLGQLEDIQEDLGIDLRVYHKLMDMLYCGEPNILYVKDKGVIVQVGVLEIDYCKKKIIFYKDSLYNDEYVYGFYAYGKTWALTKEELL